MKRVFSASLLCALLPALLSGCLAGTPPVPDDKLERLTGLRADTVLLTVDGTPIPADLYYYWAENTLQTVDYTYYDGLGVDWADSVGTLSMQDYVRYDTLESVRLYAVAASRAEAYGCGRDEALERELAAARAEYVELLGGEESFAEMLDSRALREESFFQLLASSLLFERLLSRLYGPGGEFYPAPEQLDAYCREQGVYQIKYLRFPGDETGTALAREALALLRAENDPAARFDALTETHSDAPPPPAYADGYLFTGSRMLAYDEQYGEYLFEADGMAAEIFAVTAALEEGEVSEIFPCGLEQYIVLRLPVTQALLVDAYCADSFYALLDEWAQASEVVYTDAFSRVDERAYYENTMRLA